MAEVLQQQNVGHIIQVSNNLQLRCQNLKVGTCVMWRTEPRSGKGSPPSTQPCFYFEGSGVQDPACNSYSRQSLQTSDAGRWAGMNKPGHLGCKTWIHPLCCLCELLWFESSQKFPRTVFSSILVQKRISAFSHPCWVDDRAAFTLHTQSVLKRRSCLQSKNQSKVVSTTCYHIYSRVQTHVVTAPQRMMYSVYIPSPKQAAIDSTVTNYLPEKQINL